MRPTAQTQDGRLTFAEWYARDYLARHAAPVCRLFHLLGPPTAVVYLAVVLWLELWWLVLLTPVPIYFLAWLGHVAAGNRPTFFEHPWWSFLAYWKMIAAMLVGNW